MKSMVSGEMCTERNENDKKEKFVSRRDKINDDECCKLKLSTSMNEHILVSRRGFLRESKWKSRFKVLTGLQANVFSKQFLTLHPSLL